MKLFRARGRRIRPWFCCKLIQWHDSTVPLSDVGTGDCQDSGTKRKACCFGLANSVYLSSSTLSNLYHGAHPEVFCRSPKAWLWVTWWDCYFRQEVYLDTRGSYSTCRQLLCTAASSSRTSLSRKFHRRNHQSGSILAVPSVIYSRSLSCILATLSNVWDNPINRTQKSPRLSCTRWLPSCIHDSLAIGLCRTAHWAESDKDSPHPGQILFDVD